MPTSWVIDTESDSNPAVDLTNIPDPDVIEPNAIQITPLDGLEAQQAISIANESLAKDRMRIRATPPDELHSAQQGNASELAREIARLFGRRVVVFSPDGRGVPFNAFVNTDPRLKGVIFINNTASRPYLLTTGHELYHSLEISSPELTEQLRRELEPLMVSKETLNRDKPEYAEDRRYHETVADLLGDFLADSDFWDGLENRNPSLFSKVAGVVTRWLDKVASVLRQRGFESSQYFNDIDRAGFGVSSPLSPLSIGEN